MELESASRLRNDFSSVRFKHKVRALVKLMRESAKEEMLKAIRWNAFNALRTYLREFSHSHTRARAN